MLRFIRYILLAGVVVALWWAFRRFRASLTLAVGAVPRPWRELAEHDARLREALDLRERVRALAERRDSLVEPRVVAEVDEALEPLVRLVSLRVELSRQLGALDRGAIARDAEHLGPERVAEQQARVDAVAGHERRLEGEVAEAVADLRAIYLDLLEGVTSAGVETHEVEARTRVLAEQVRGRVEAEREVAELLAMP